MTTQDPGFAYDSRAEEYVSALGTMSAVAETDRRTVEGWADDVVGPVLDAGCGPGHWAAHLAARGIEVYGVDLSSEFLSSASRRFPATPFRRGDLRDLPFPDETFGGVLAWYSLIHLPPADMPAAFGELARVLRPGGTLCLGFFHGPDGESFDHAVTTAWWWSVPGLTKLLDRSGFRVLGSSTRQDEGTRPHADIVAVLDR